MSIKDYSNEYTQNENVFTKENNVSVTDIDNLPQTESDYDDIGRNLNPASEKTSQDKLHKIIAVIAVILAVVGCVFIYRGMAISNLQKSIEGKWVYSTKEHDDNTVSNVTSGYAIVFSDDVLYLYRLSQYQFKDKNGNLEGQVYYNKELDTQVNYQIIYPDIIKIYDDEGHYRNIQVSVENGILKTKNETAFLNDNIGIGEKWYSFSVDGNNVADWAVTCFEKG